MKGVIVHATLLVVMLVYGYRTWTQDKTDHPVVGDVVDHRMTQDAAHACPQR